MPLNDHKATPTGEGDHGKDRDMPPKIINITPTWRGYLPVLVELATNAGDEGRRAGRIELRRMAVAADRWSAIAKYVESNEYASDGLREAVQHYARTIPE